MDHARDRLIETIRSSVIGDDQVLRAPTARAASPTPTTPRRDDRSRFIEDFIRDARAAALRQHPHRDLGARARRPRRFREDARAIIHERRRRLGPTTSSSSAAPARPRAIHKLVDVLNLRAPRRARRALRPLRALIPDAERPVVFIGPYEHHSNELPWRESIADVVTIDEDADGHIDLGRLERGLVAPRRAARSRSAASRPRPT